MGASMTAQEFLNQYQGKFAYSRGGIPGQCVDTVQKFAELNGVGGTPVFPVAAAKDMAGTRGDSFDFIANSPTNVPNPGDIVIWNTAVGPYGHTAIFLDGNANSFRSIDSNWPVGTPIHIQSHNYNGVVGWLRFKQAAPTPQGEPKMTPDQEKLAYQIVLGRDPEPGAPLGQRTGFGFISDARKEIEANRAGTANQIKQLNDRVNDLQNTLNKANELIEKLSNDTTSATLTKQIEKLQTRIKELENSTPTSLDSYSIGELISAVFKKIFNKEV